MLASLKAGDVVEVGKMKEITPRQRALMEAVIQGESYKVTAFKLGIAPNTLKSHFFWIKKKLKGKNRIDTIIKYLIHEGRLIENETRTVYERKTVPEKR